MPGKPLASILSRLRADGPAEPAADLPSEISSSARGASVVSPEGFLALIEMMRESERYDWADETLRGIYDTVEASQCVTEGQRRAVFNIRHSRDASEDPL